jgi:hypothetical protein
MRYLLVILLFANSVAFAGTTGTAAWFAVNWFKEQSKVTKAVDNDDDVIQPIGMDEYVKACTELTSDKQFCKKNWIDARMSGTEIILVPVDRPRQVKKSTEREVTKVAKSEVKVVKYTAHSKVKGVNLLDVSNEEYKTRRAATLAKPNAVVIQETYR